MASRLHAAADWRRNSADSPPPTATTSGPAASGIWASGLSRLWARGRVAERLPPLGNLVISNVPGPPVPLYIAGARIVHNHPVSIVTHGLGLNVTVNGYAEWLEFGVLACRDALPDARPLARGIERAFNELSRRIDA